MVAIDNQPISITSEIDFVDLLATLEPRYLF